MKYNIMLEKGDFMERFADFVVRHRKPIIFIFILAALLSIVLWLFVTVNYNMADYLPVDARSTKALEIMENEFTQPIPNVTVMIKNVSLTQAVEYKEKLCEIEGVQQVIWLDDTVDVKIPLEMQDPEVIGEFYKDGSALFSVSIVKGMERKACDAIRALIGKEYALAGEAADLDFIQKSTNTETLGAIAILLPIILIILLVSSSSWLEPLLFLAAIGVSVLINMGTNVIFGEISFLTNAISPILQLAVSLDYAIFLLRSFADNREKYGDTAEAMRRAVKCSLRAVASSAATTLFGFIALIFMDFQIGADLGICLAKGILFSFISVMVFLPALTLCLYKGIDKTRHRRLLPDFRGIGRTILKFTTPVLVIVTILLVPSFLGQRKTNFLYGNGDPDPNSMNGRGRREIEETFGRSNIMVLLVPRGDLVKEQALCREIQQLDAVANVVSYANMAGTAIPPEYLGQEITGQFYSEHYTRILVYTDTAQEGAQAFRTVEEVNKAAGRYYGESFYSAGQSANLYDMKTTVWKDNLRVTLLAVLAIFLVLLVSFKSAVLPLLLLLTIEAGIWINLAIPYFAGTSINFIGYLVLNTVQLGATVDYAILLTDHYMSGRKSMDKKNALKAALGETFQSVLISAATLCAAGFTLYLTSSNPSVCDIGLLLGRGTLISMLMVLCFLPALLLLCDKIIGKTTWKSAFYRKPAMPEKENSHEIC